MKCEPDNLSGKGTIVFLAANASYSHTNLAGWYLRECAVAAGWEWREVEVIQTDSLAAALQKVLGLQPDVLAASFYLFNANFLLSFMTRFKALRPDCCVIGGGPEFLGDNSSFLKRHPEINAVIRGEGERALSEWLEYCKKPEEWGGIKGLCAIIDGNYIDNGRTELIKNLDEISSPFHANLMDGDFRVATRSITKPEGCHSRRSGNPEQNKYLDSHFHGNDRNRVDERRLEINSSGFKKPFLLLETSRGCSNKCAFCTSAGEHVRFFSLERIKNDLGLIAAAGVKEVRIADRTFNENLSRCMALIKIMRDDFKDIKFHLEVDPARVAPEMIQELALAESGKFHLEVGIQAARSGALCSIGRFGSVEYSLAVLNQLCHLRNIAIHVDLIAGLPGVGMADLYADLQAIALMEPDEIQLELLKVLPGTQLSREKEKFGIIAADEPPYEVLQTADMGFDELFAAQRLSRLVDWFYNTTELQEVLAAAIRLVPAFFERFGDFCGNIAGESHAPALENRFRLLEQFARLYASALIPKLGYAWLKWGLSAQHGICRTTQWKKPIPAEAVLVEGESVGERHRIYLAELGKKYLFVYGQYPRRQASAIYVIQNTR